jgi:hypothetical protein
MPCAAGTPTVALILFRPCPMCAQILRRTLESYKSELAILNVEDVLHTLQACFIFCFGAAVWTGGTI